MKEESYFNEFGPITYPSYNRQEDFMKRRVTVEKRYCEKKLRFIKNDKGILINAGRKFVYKGEMKESDARIDYPGCLLSRCCERKIRKSQSIFHFHWIIKALCSA